MDTISSTYASLHARLSAKSHAWRVRHATLPRPQAPACAGGCDRCVSRRASSHVWVGGAQPSSCPSFFAVNAAGTHLVTEICYYAFSKNTSTTNTIQLYIFHCVSTHNTNKISCSRPVEASRAQWRHPSCWASQTPLARSALATCGISSRSEPCPSSGVMSSPKPSWGTLGSRSRWEYKVDSSWC